MTSIFVSYARSDSTVVVGFVERLRAAGFDVWLDQTSIAASVPWREEIVKAIRSADLVIMMQSPAWQASANCADEFNVARELDQPILYIDVQDESSDWLEAVRSADGQIGPIQRARAMLLGASYRWDRARRPATHLAAGRTLRMFRSVAGTTSDPVAQEFVRAALRLRRRRLTVGVLAALVTGSLFFGMRLTSELNRALDERIASMLADAGRERQVSDALSAGPAVGLRTALQLAEADDTWATRSGLALALRTRVPDEVSGTVPDRATAAPFLIPGTRLTRGSDVLVVTPEGVRVEGAQTLKVVVPGGVTALAWGPDGSRFAAATPHGVVLTRVSSGRQMATLRGFDGQLTRLEWNDDGIVGHAGSAQARWSMNAITILADTGWTTSALSARPDGSVLLAGRSGELALWDGVGLEQLRTAVGPDWPARIVPTATGWLVADGGPAGDGELVAVSAAGDIQGSIDLGDCSPNSLIVDDPTVFVACWDRVVQVDPATGQTTPLATGVFHPSALLRDVDGTLLATSIAGELFRLSGRTWEPVGLWASGCTSGAAVVAPSPDGRRLLFTGSGVAGMCTNLRNSPEDRGSQTRVLPPSGIQTIRAATWSPGGGRVVAAAASGELWVFDPDQYLTVSTTLPTGEELVGVQFLDASTVVVASRSGELATVDLTLDVADFDTWKAQAGHRLDLAVAAGLG